MTLPSTTSPVLALKASILARLGGDSILRSLLGGARIYDKTPRGQPFRSPRSERSSRRITRHQATAVMKRGSICSYFHETAAPKKRC